MTGKVMICETSNFKVNCPLYLTKEKHGFRLGETACISEASILSLDEFERLKENHRIPADSKFIKGVNYE